jgi:hypothetical protein
MSEKIIDIFKRMSLIADGFSCSFSFSDTELKTFKADIELTFNESVMLGFSKDKTAIHSDFRKVGNDLKKAVKEKEALLDE